MEPPHLFVRSRPNRELGLFVRDAVVRDDLLLPLHRDLSLHPDLRAWPMDHGMFLRSPSDLHCLVNHACLPTAYVDWERPAIRALRSLNEGEEITVNYLTIYERLTNPIECHCGDCECLHEIRGFSHLTLEQKLGLELYLSPHLRRGLNEQVKIFRAQAS